MDALVPLLVAALMLALAARVLATLDSPWPRRRDRRHAPRHPVGRHDSGVAYDEASWRRLTEDQDGDPVGDRRDDGSRGATTARR